MYLSYISFTLNRLNEWQSNGTVMRLAYSRIFLLRKLQWRHGRMTDNSSLCSLIALNRQFSLLMAPFAV